MWSFVNRRNNLTPTLVASRTALPPEGVLFPLGRPGGKVVAPTLVASLVRT